MLLERYLPRWLTARSGWHAISTRWGGLALVPRHSGFGGKHAARKIKRAQILLAADADVSDDMIASSLCGPRRVRRIEAVNGHVGSTMLLRHQDANGSFGVPLLQSFRPAPAITVIPIPRKAL
jgi:hypothetical protein